MNALQIKRLNVLLSRRGLQINIESEMKVNKTNCIVYEIDGLNPEDVVEDENKILLFTSDQSVGKAEVLKIISFAENIKHFILFSQNISLQANNILQKLSGVFAETLNNNDICFDKCKSKLVCSYKILSKQEEHDLLKKKCLTKEQLPKMLRNDPMARYLGFPAESLVLAIETGNYRHIVNK